MQRHRGRRSTSAITVLAAPLVTLALAALTAAPATAVLAAGISHSAAAHHVPSDTPPRESGAGEPLVSPTDQILTPRQADRAVRASRARRRASSGPGPFLTRPYWNWHGVNSIFDHCNPTYAVDGRICNVDGTVAIASNGQDPWFPKGYAATPGGQDYVYYDGHNGWDIALNYETLLAAAPGRVTYAAWDYAGCSTCGYGQTVIIDHGNGFSTRYGHMSQIWVSPGQDVYRGQPIGVSGATGNVTGPHLHFGVYVNSTWTAIDPWGWQGSSADPWPYDAGDLWLGGNPINPLPDAPTGVRATAGDSSALVTWSAPAWDGGSGVGSYTVTASPGGATVTTPGNVTQATFAGLTNGTPYTFTVTARVQAGTGPASAASSAVAPIGAHPQYFAEGTTRPGFQEYLSLLNTGGATHATIKYLFANGSAPRYQIVSLAARSRTTVDVNGSLGAQTDVAAVVDADGGGVLAERVLYFKSCLGDHVCMDGGDVAMSTQPARTWYFAEGTTRPGFQEYLTLSNPASETANVTVTYLFPGGGTVQKTYSVGPLSRYTADVNADAGGGRDVSISVSSDRPVVAERPMYFEACTVRLCVNGGDVTAGGQPANTWNFAEGTTRTKFEEYLTMLNPGSQTVSVTARFSYGPGQTGPASLTYQVPPGRFTRLLNGDVGSGKDVSMALTSSGPIVAERPMYFDACPGTGAGNAPPVCANGGDVSLGAAPASTWYFAEGYTAPGFQEYLSLQNPSATAGTAAVTYLFPDGASSVETVPLPANSRTTVDVNALVGAGRQVSVSITSTVGIVAERPIYFHGCPGPICIDGGDVAVGATRLP